MGSGASAQFIYSRDLARLFIWVLRSYHDPSPISPVSGREGRGDLQGRGQHHRQGHGLPGRGALGRLRSRRPVQEDGQQRQAAQPAPRLPVHQLRAGVKESVDWFVNNYDTARKGEASRKEEWENVTALSLTPQRTEARVAALRCHLSALATCVLVVLSALCWMYRTISSFGVTSILPSCSSGSAC